MKPVYFKTLLAGAALLLAQGAYAVQHTYWLDNFAIAEANDGDTTGVRILSGNPHSGYSFTLDDGQATPWFSALDIWTDEKHVSADDLWTNPFSLVTTITSGSESLTYKSEGESVGIRWADWSGSGYVSFFPAADFQFGNRVLRLEFANTYFSSGPKKYYGLAPGQEKGATLMARLYQVSSHAPVSVPDSASTGVILGLGLAALALAARARSRA